MSLRITTALLLLQLLGCCWAEASLLRRPRQAGTARVSCGARSVCVPKWDCRNPELNSEGNFVISIQPELSSGLCNYMETCCSMDETIYSEWKEFSEEEEMAPCGTRNVNGVKCTLGGALQAEAQFGEFPWMVAIFVKLTRRQFYLGGGSILAPNIILTAANKVVNRNVRQLVVRAGEWDMNSTAEIYPHLERGVSEIIIHDEYSMRTTANNVALLVLALNLGSNPHISPICLPKVERNFDYAQCMVMGWGKDSAKQRTSHKILKRIRVPILPRYKCLQMFASNPAQRFLVPSTICAGGHKEVDMCESDSGAPLVCPITGLPTRYQQVGIVTWGIRCGEHGLPGVYVNVPLLMPWITAQLDRLGVDRKYYNY